MDINDYQLKNKQNTEEKYKEYIKERVDKFKERLNIILIHILYCPPERLPRKRQRCNRIRGSTLRDKTGQNISHREALKQLFEEDIIEGSEGEYYYDKVFTEGNKQINVKGENVINIEGKKVIAAIKELTKPPKTPKQPQPATSPQSQIQEIKPKSPSSSPLPKPPKNTNKPEFEGKAKPPPPTPTPPRNNNIRDDLIKLFNESLNKFKRQYAYIEKIINGNQNTVIIPLNNSLCQESEKIIQSQSQPQIKINKGNNINKFIALCYLINELNCILNKFNDYLKQKYIADQRFTNINTKYNLQNINENIQGKDNPVTYLKTKLKEIMTQNNPNINNENMKKICERVKVILSIISQIFKGIHADLVKEPQNTSPDYDYLDAEKIYSEAPKNQIE